jgi:hypothetical protein
MEHEDLLVNFAGFVRIFMEFGEIFEFVGIFVEIVRIFWDS